MFLDEKKSRILKFRIPIFAILSLDISIPFPTLRSLNIQQRIAQTRNALGEESYRNSPGAVLIVDRRRIGRHKILKRFQSRRQTAGGFGAQQSPKLPSFTVQSSS